MPSYVYILANKKNGTLYVGVAADLVKRVWEHKTKAVKGFTSKYNVDKLVYYEMFDDISEAIQREKIVKKWNRGWKTKRIYEMNPEWEDLYEEISV
jgi:putative endonuclease